MAALLIRSKAIAAALLSNEVGVQDEFQNHNTAVTLGR